MSKVQYAIIDFTKTNCSIMQSVRSVTVVGPRVENPELSIETIFDHCSVRGQTSNHGKWSLGRTGMVPS